MALFIKVILSTGYYIINRFINQEDLTMDYLSLILKLFQIILTIFNIIIILYGFYIFLTKPRTTLEKRVQALEVKMAEAEKSLLQGNDRFRSQDETLEVLIRSTLALIEFEVQYCITENKPISDDLKKVKEDLHIYLSHKN